MDALLRELHEGPDGIAEYHDTEIKADALTIGSRSNQRIQLLGRAVALEHAIIRKAGRKLELTCRRGCRARLNGQIVFSAKLEAGDVIEIGGHRLKVAEAPAGFDAAIELTPNTNIDASEFESAFQTNLRQTRLNKRTLAWGTIVLVVLAGLVSPLVAINIHRGDHATPAWMPSDEFWNSGPLSAAHHQVVGERCDSCHQKLFKRVQDQACQKCHETIHDHVTPAHLAFTTLGPTQRCATCHREHNEPETFLVDRSDSLCVGCHADSQTKFGKLALDAVHGFGEDRHPAFKPHLLKSKAPTEAGGVFEWLSEVTTMEKAVENSNLKFSHQQHLDPERVLRTSDSKALGCADCHRLEVDGEHFAPITMENRCASCHELTFDPGAPDRQLPHGKPREVVLTLQDYFTRKFSDPNAGRATRERRRLPGHDEEEQTCTGVPFDCAMRSARAEIANQFTRRGCVGCHVVNETASDNVFEHYQVVPVRLARDYLPAAHFDHRSHLIQGNLTGDAACQSCHASKESKLSSELLLPTITKCEKCHGDTPAVDRITLHCTSCHAYHPHAMAEASAQADEQ
jgi:predicted CXXCH cytochrome family protein